MAGYTSGMSPSDIVRMRIANQHIAAADFTKPQAVVGHMLAMQAQDYSGGLWAIGLRMDSAGKETVEQAIVDRQIVRTWPMRGTLHFVAAEDIRWMLRLLTPRVLSGAASRHRNLELDDEVFAKAAAIVRKELQDGQVKTRSQLMAALEARGIATRSQRGIHILWYLSMQELICFGPHAAKEPTFVLLDSWLPKTRELAADEAVAELTQRFFISHGPATEADLARWSGLPLGMVRRGIETVKAQLASADSNGETFWFHRDTPAAGVSDTFLLPGFDEFILGYKNRSLMIELAENQSKIVPGNNGVFQNTIVSDGRVIGTWRRAAKRDHLAITLLPFQRLAPAEQHAAEIVAGRYAAFFDTTATVTTA